MPLCNIILYIILDIGKLPSLKIQMPYFKRKLSRYSIAKSNIGKMSLVDTQTNCQSRLKFKFESVWKFWMDDFFFFWECTTLYMCWYYIQASAVIFSKIEDDWTAKFGIYFYWYISNPHRFLSRKLKCNFAKLKSWKGKFLNSKRWHNRCCQSLAPASLHCGKYSLAQGSKQPSNDLNGVIPFSSGRYMWWPEYW